MKDNNKMTDTTEFVNDLAGGVFAKQIGLAISDVAHQVNETGKKGQVKIVLDIYRLGETGAGRVNIKHKLESTTPTTHGSQKEDYTRETPMYVNADGTVTLFDNSSEQLFGKPVMA